MIHSGVFTVRRKTDEVFDLLSKPEHFAPLLPDFESMAMQDAAHFSMRTVIAIGEIKGHANFGMELVHASRPIHVEYRGSATIAGSPLRLAIDFKINQQAEMTEIAWQGEVKLEGMLAMMAGSLLDTMGRQNFERMAERLQQALQIEAVPACKDLGGDSLPEDIDFDI